MNSIEYSFIEKYMDDPNVLAIYPLGSRVYGTHTEESDYDYILVCKSWFDSGDINMHVYTAEQFRLALDNHEIQALECFYLDKKRVFADNLGPNFLIIDKSKLRTSVSTISSNSWVKGKKKLIIAGDYDPYAAIKSVFHSLRILDFSIQIATSGKIVNYASMNWVLTDLKKLAEQYQRDELWHVIDTKYRALHNEKSTQFKLLCPKAMNENDYKKQLKVALKNHDISDAELNKIIAIFK